MTVETKGDVLGELRAALREQGRADAESCTVLTAAATLRPPGKAFLLPGLASAFRSACLGPLFARYAVQKGRPVELQEGIFDCSKLGRYHFHVDPAIVPSANNHPFQDWLDKLRDFTGTHSLSPAPLVPWPVYSGTLLHSLSCCLVGLEMYWKVLALAVARELNGDNYHRYQALLGRGAAADEEIETIISALNPEGVELELRTAQAVSLHDGAGGGRSVGGLEVFYHPVLVQAASNVLGRTIILMDVLGTNRTGGGMHQGVYAPWKCLSPENEAPVLPPLCAAWENASRTRIVPLVPTSLSDTSCRVLPDQLAPKLAFAHLHQLEQGGAGTWDVVKRELLPTDRRGRCQLISGSAKAMSQQYLADLIAVMSANFRRILGLSLQTLVDVRSLLFDLGVGDVALEELVLDTIAVARNDRLYYNPVSCQLTMRRGLYTEDDLKAPNGRLYLAALAHQSSPDAAQPPPPPAAAGSPSATGRCAGGVRLLGVDVPTYMPPGMLRVYVSVERAGQGEGGADDGGEPGVAESVFLIVKNTSPTGQTRTARVSKALADVEVALGIEVPLRETGTHSITVSISPVYGPGGDGGAPLSVAVLDAGQYDVVVEEGADERRANQGRHGVRADYSNGIRLREEPACLFSMGPGGLSACDKMVCRVTGDADRMRQLNAAGEPLYYNGDCTHTPSTPGSCCDRKHFWEGLEYDNYPVVFNLSLNCPTHYDASGNTTVAIVWHECESNPLRNSNVYQISSAIIEKFWPDEPECPWYGWEAQLNDVILREMPQDRGSQMRDCPRRKWLSGFVGGVDLNH